MKIEQRKITTETLSAVVTLLNGAIPDLTATRLVEALKGYSEGKQEQARERLITRKAAADLLGVSMITFWRMEKSGAIHAVTLPTGGKRIRERDVMTLLQQGGEA